jgi:hypothetical protein
LPSLAAALLFALLCLASSCKHSGPIGGGEVMYVSAPEATLRDHVATIYNRVGTVKNGERVQVLERQRRFVRVRTPEKVEGWVELRALVPSETYDQFQQLSTENRTTPVEGRGVTRTELNMHVAPGRDADTLYQLAESAKVEMLKRASSVRATPEEIAAKRAAELARLAGEPVKPAPKKHATPAANRTESNPASPPSATGKPQAHQANLSASARKTAAKASANPGTASAPGDAATQEAPPAPMDDWWLVRDQQGHTGWVLARMVDLDVPLDVAQYAEGQRIQAAFVLNTVQDEEKGAVPQYLVLLNENRDGISYDFNQVRVFTWNLKKHRYETGYREHYIIGYFPVQVATEDFGREGAMPVFTVRIQNEDGSISPRKYRLIGNVVRQVLAPGEVTPKAAHSPDEPKKLLAEKKPRQGKAGAHQGKKH